MSEKRGKKKESRSDIDAMPAAVEAAIAAPEKDDAWNRLEDLAASAQRPDEVADAYRTVLSCDLSRAAAGKIGQRAVRFLEEWFGDDPQVLASVLERVLAIDPEAECAF